LNSIATRPAQDTLATGDRIRGVQEDFDRQAMERGENEGMFVHQCVTSIVHNRRNPDAITTR
jgi:hypothetical protein